MPPVDMDALKRMFEEIKTQNDRLIERVTALEAVRQAPQAQAPQALQDLNAQQAPIPQQPAQATVHDDLDDTKKWGPYLVDPFSLQVLRQALVTRHQLRAPMQWQEELGAKIELVCDWAKAASARRNVGHALSEQDYAMGQALLNSLRCDSSALRQSKDVRAARRALALQQGDDLDQVVAKVPNAPSRFSKSRGSLPQRLPPRVCRRCGRQHTGPWSAHTCTPQNSSNQPPEPIRL